MGKQSRRHSHPRIENPSRYPKYIYVECAHTPPAGRQDLAYGGVGEAGGGG